jgi:membrane associated rhomboid family serine protease
MTIIDDLRNAFKYPNNGLMRLIAVNIVVFVVLAVIGVLLWIMGLENIFQLIRLQITLPARLDLLMYRPWTLFTYGLVHTDPFHILFNMLSLYWFGKVLTEYLGSKRLVGTFVMGVFVGGLIYILAYNLIPRLAPALNSDTLRLIGASGGVYAIVVAAATIAPNTVFYMLLLGPIRIVYIAWFMVFLSFIEITSLNTGGNLAHLGGALFGYLFVKQLQSGRDLTKFVTNTMAWISGLFSRKPKMKVHYIKPEKTTVLQKKQSKQQSAKADTDTQAAVPNQDEIDKILDKISDKGYESLTKEEKQKLFDASRR